jgi:hypothetical protein
VDPAALAAVLVVVIVIASLTAVGYVPDPITGGRRRAARRADALMRELLTPDEYARLQRQGYLDVPSGACAGRVYRVPAGLAPVVVVDNGVALARLCLRPVCSLPPDEVVLVRKVLLEAAEGDFWRRANVLGGWPGHEPPFKARCPGQQREEQPGVPDVL